MFSKINKRLQKFTKKYRYEVIVGLMAFVGLISLYLIEFFMKDRWIHESYDSGVVPTTIGFLGGTMIAIFLGRLLVYKWRIRFESILYFVIILALILFFVLCFLSLLFWAISGFADVSFIDIFTDLCGHIWRYFAELPYNKAREFIINFDEKYIHLASLIRQIPYDYSYKFEYVFQGFVAALAIIFPIYVFLVRTNNLFIIFGGVVIGFGTDWSFSRGEFWKDTNRLFLYIFYFIFILFSVLFIGHYERNLKNKLFVKKVFLKRKSMKWSDVFSHLLLFVLIGISFWFGMSITRYFADNLNQFWVVQYKNDSWFHFGDLDGGTKRSNTKGCNFDQDCTSSTIKNSQKLPKIKIVGFYKTTSGEPEYLKTDVLTMYDYSYSLAFVPYRYKSFDYFTTYGLSYDDINKLYPDSGTSVLDQIKTIYVYDSDSELPLPTAYTVGSFGYDLAGSENQLDSNAFGSESMISPSGVEDSVGNSSEVEYESDNNFLSYSTGMGLLKSNSYGGYDSRSSEPGVTADLEYYDYYYFSGGVPGYVKSYYDSHLCPSSGAWIYDFSVSKNFDLNGNECYVSNPFDNSYVDSSFTPYVSTYSDNYGKIKTLTKNITKSGESDIDKAQLLENYFHDNYEYSLTPGITDVQNPIDDFILYVRKGYCQHFAAAMVYMLRTMDIQARVVTGYYSDTYSEEFGAYVIFNRDLHAWVEVRDQETGEIYVFDPTSAKLADDMKEEWLTGPSKPAIQAELAIADSVKSLSFNDLYESEDSDAIKAALKANLSNNSDSVDKSQDSYMDGILKDVIKKLSSQLNDVKLVLKYIIIIVILFFVIIVIARFIKLLSYSIFYKSLIRKNREKLYTRMRLVSIKKLIVKKVNLQYESIYYTDKKFMDLLYKSNIPNDVTEKLSEFLHICDRILYSKGFSKDDVKKVKTFSLTLKRLLNKF
ncbi:transglutaminase domain-containing protein [Candidatus Dojkabacteria bacterium]|nr:transglutaminase domain-containing protein [Candidatus Dojkabacteria bacterium]